MMNRIIRYEQNPQASWRTCNNGGGYFQPLYLIIGDGWKAEISDNSCGDFGDEVSATIAVGGKLYECWYGTRTEGNAYSNIPYYKCKNIIEAIHRVIGYSLPVRSRDEREWWNPVKEGDIDIDLRIDEIIADYASNIAYGYDLDPDSSGYSEWYSDDDDDEESSYQHWTVDGADIATEEDIVISAERKRPRTLSRCSRRRNVQELQQ